MEDPLFKDDFPIETTISSGFANLPRLMKPEGIFQQLQVGHRLYDKARIRGLFDPLLGKPRSHCGDGCREVFWVIANHLMIYIYIYMYVYIYIYTYTCICMGYSGI